ncbi:hypothetical protein ALC62_00139 [Cyphomyrmex costatus]|uniref:CCHC-type domain-containing protein n=2 Tax=Cyphomyrmex costatus TaxID=456900 RepID=A0A151K296_9HYME|nr:hypothetical protein ALC62_00139 [Cyphomyrmex costatus]
MDLNELKLEQIKNILRHHELPTAGRKAELIARLREADPTGSWIDEGLNRDNEEEDVFEETTEDNIEENNAERDCQASTLARRETELEVRERELMSREIALLRRENDLLRGSPQNSHSSVDSRTTINIKNVGELLSEYDGSGEDFQRWKAQANLLCHTYELNENASKILIGSKLRGKAQRWYHSKAEHLSMNTNELLREMESMFNLPLGKLDSRRKFEARTWKTNEAFSDYCHDKLILGNKVPIIQDELIEYVIDGIPSESLQNQARMQSFSSVQELTKAFKKITLKTETTNRRSTTLPWNDPQKKVDRKIVDSKEPMKIKMTTTTRGVVKCYKCNQAGHYARDCTAEEPQPGGKIAKSKIPPKTTSRTEKQVGVVNEEENSDSGESREENDQNE